MASSYSNDNFKTNSDEKPNVAIIIVLALVLFFEFAFLGFNSMPHLTQRRPAARRAACFSNIRILQGAVEMYNMDYPYSMKSLDIDLLVKGKYLKSKPSSPEVDCLYLSEGDLNDSGRIYCKLHGEYDKQKENELRKKEANDKIKENIQFYLFYIFLYSIPSLIYLFFTFINKSESYFSFITLFILPLILIVCSH